MKQKLLLLLLIVLAVPVTMMADDPVEIGGITYNLIPKAKIAKVAFNHNNYRGDVVIPATVEYENEPYTVKEIEDYAFYSCSSLTSVSIPNSVTSIGQQAFRYCSSLTSINIPDGVTSIGDYFFQNCSSLTSIDIPNNVTSIGNYAFSGCTNIISIDIPDNVTSIGNTAFENCTNLISIHVASRNPVYDSRDNCNAIIETVSNTLIVGCQNSTIPSSVTRIGDYAFCNCKSLNSIDFPSSITHIGNYAFHGCNLTSVDIPNSVVEIQSYAFALCPLSSIILHSQTISFGYACFHGCAPKLFEYHFNVNLLYSNSTILQYNLETLIIGDEVTSISNTIGNINDISNLKNVTIGSGITDVGDNFKNCDNLDAVTCHSTTPPTAESTAFDGSYIEYATLIVPDEAYNAYSTTAPWSNFGTILKLSENSHTISIDTSANGSISATVDGAPVSSGDNIGYHKAVILSNSPNLGCVFDHYIVTAADGTEVTVTDGSFIMPSQDVTVSAVFIGPKKVTINNLNGGVLSVMQDDTAITSGTDVTVGTTLTISHTTSSGYIFEHYTVTAADGTEVPVTYGSFTMPSQDVTVSAVFREAAINTVTINNQEGGVLCVMQGNTEITSGTNVMEGTILTISHTPAEGYVLDHYTVTDGNGTVIPLDETNSFAMPDTPVVIDVAYKGVYEIASLEDLVALANYVNEGNPTLGLCWIQTADIDISSISAWKPIGVGEHNATYNGPSTLSSEGFAGTYDGQGHVITGANLSDSESEAVGIFGIVTGTVKRLGVTGANYNATKDCRGGALVGIVAASSNSTGLVENCFVTNSSIKTGSRVGGALAGAVYGGVVSNCYTANNTVTGARYGYVTGDTKSDRSYNGTVQYCYTNGSSVTSSQSGTTTSCEGNVSAERFASGEIAYLLNGSYSTNPTWYQTIGSDNYPILIESDGNTVSCEHRFSCTNTDLGINYNNNGREGDTTEHLFTLVPANFDSESGGDNTYNKCVYCGQIFAMDADPTANPQALDNIPPITASYGDAFTLPSTITEGQTITWTSNDTDIANISDNTLTITSVGTATITATIDGGTSFDAVTQDYTLTANKAPLTITVKDHAIVIGETLPTTYEIEYTGFKNGDDESVLTAQPTFSCSATSDSGIGTYDIIASGAEADNYEITYVNGTLTIDAAIATITIPAEGMTTYSLNHDLDFSGVTDFKAYIIMGYNKKTNKVIAVEVDEAPAGTGLYLAGTPGTYQVPLGESGTYYMNMLKGVTTATTIPATNGDFANLTLSSATTPTFAPASDGSSVDANTAYLQIETAKYNGQPIELLLMDKELLGDINKDGNVTIVDVMMVVDIILNQ